jgi:hypothetical protein
MENETSHSEHPPSEPDGVEMPRPTAAPLVLSLGLVLLAAGAVTSVAFMVVGGGLFFIGLGMWIESLLPGRGHVHEPLVAAALQTAPIVGAPGTVEQLRAGVPGYRIRMPEQVHPISAGVKGGIFGGFVMPLPAVAYGVLSGHGIWYPVNLLTGMVLPGMDQMTTQEFEQFHLGYLILGVSIHAVMSVILGMIYGVLMPMLPEIPKPLAWGALLAPMLWTGVSYVLMSFVNPALAHGVAWPWFIASQFVFGVVLALVVMQADGWHPVRSGLLGALIGALVMPLPAILWGRLSGHGIWYPVNLLAGMVTRGMDQLPVEELMQFHANWLIAAIFIHALFAIGFGAMLGFLLPRLPSIPGPLAWGGMLLPLVWTATSYAMMGVVNPLLAERVDWPWFIFSQIIFGLAAAVVVVRSEMVHIAPAGTGPDRLEIVEH